MGADGKKRYGFEKGGLIIVDNHSQMFVRAWPDPVARSRRWHNKWRQHSPEFRLIASRKRADRQSVDQLVFSIEPDASDLSIAVEPQSKKKAYAALRATVPDVVADGLEVFRSYQWNLIRFAFYLDQIALDLMASNPVLAFMLANHKWYSQIIGVPEHGEKAKRIASLKQKDLLAKLKCPGTKSVVNLIRKLRVESVSPETLELLRGSLADESTVRQLTRLDSINAGVLGILGNKEISGAYTNKLLIEVSQASREVISPFAMHTIEEVCYMCKNGRPRREPPVFSSLKKLEAFHEDISTSFVRLSSHKFRYCKIPKPPLLGTDDIIPLTTPLKIQKEGKAQKNCVGSYSRRVAQGGTYIYKILAPERATLSIVRAAGGTWQIGELLLAGNHDVGADTVVFVEKWIEENTVSI